MLWIIEISHMRQKHDPPCFHQKPPTSSWSLLPPRPLLAGGDRRPPASSPATACSKPRRGLRGGEGPRVGQEPGQTGSGPPPGGASGVPEQWGWDGLRAFLLPGLSHPLHPHPGSSPFQASLAFGFSSPNKKRCRAPGPPPSQAVFSPQGTRRAPSRGTGVVAGY